MLYRKISKYQGNCFKFSKIILVEKIVKRKRYSYRISLTMVYFHIYANQNMFLILNVNRPCEDKTTKLFHCVHKRFAIFCLKKINGNKIGLLFFHSVVRPYKKYRTIFHPDTSVSHVLEIMIILDGTH